MLLDNSIENKNQLFELFGVKKQLTQYKNIRMNDSTLNGYSSQTLYIDSLGYTIKEESFNSWSNPPKSEHEFKRDKNGNVIQIILNGKLVESRTYNDSNKITQGSLYEADTLYDKWIFNYDSLGNQIEALIVYPSEKTRRFVTNQYEYIFQNSTPLILKKIYISAGDTIIYFYDELNRIKKVVKKQWDSSTDSTLYFYTGDYFKDSLIIYYNDKIDKLTREYDERLRCNRMISYNEVDSIIQDLIFEYDDYGTEIKDSIFIANDLEVPQKPYDEMMEEQIVSRMIVNGEVSFITTTSYYPNGLLHRMIKYNYDQKRIEETNYEYEFY